MFAKMKVYCNVCGIEFLTTFQQYQGRVCSMGCCNKLEWKKTLSILGKEYYPQQKKEE